MNRQPEEEQQQHFNVNCVATRVELPTIDEDEIGTIIMKNYNNKIRRGEVTHYFIDEKKYFIVYESGDNGKVNNRTLNRYRCTDTNRDRTRRILRLSIILQRATMVKSNKNKPLPAGAKLSGHFVMAVYDETTGKMIAYKQLINHSDKQTREWWQKLSANEFGKLLKRVEKN